MHAQARVCGSSIQRVYTHTHAHMDACARPMAQACLHQHTYTHGDTHSQTIAHTLTHMCQYTCTHGELRHRLCNTATYANEHTTMITSIIMLHVWYVLYKEMRRGDHPVLVKSPKSASGGGGRYAAPSSRNGAAHRGRSPQPKAKSPSAGPSRQPPSRHESADAGHGSSQR